MADPIVNSKAFFDEVRASLFDGSLNQGQVEGINAILAHWPAAYGLPQLAYVLATPYHETERTMQPIREIGRGRGRPYGHTDPSGQVPYGRGFVQLTWRVNYLKADLALGLKGTLADNYDRALEPSIAAQILIRGMREGWFTQRKLADFITPMKNDFVGARRIINGNDDDELIAGYALKFETALIAASTHGDSK